nr:hypothetical protein [Tanacetum cinerariifolium]
EMSRIYKTINDHPNGIVTGGSLRKFSDEIHGQGLIRSPSHDAWTIARATDEAEDVGYVRALQASERRMMTSIKEINLREILEAQTEALKQENLNAKDVGGMLRKDLPKEKLEPNADETLCLNNRSCIGGLT